MSTTPPPSPFLATVDQVGAMLHARTQDTTGQELGTFTADTRPTDEQVELIAALVAGGLDAVAGRDAAADPPQEWPDALVSAGQDACVLCTCWRVEAGFFPSQTQTGQSAVQFYRDACNAAMASWQELVVRWGGPEGDAAFEPASVPLFAFPPPYVGALAASWYDPTTESYITPASRAFPAFPLVEGPGGWWAVFTSAMGNPSEALALRTTDESLRRAMLLASDELVAP